jgi:hypothetical protein
MTQYIAHIQVLDKHSLVVAVVVESQVESQVE